MLKNVSADGKKFELSLFRAEDDTAAGFVALAWTDIAAGQILSTSDEDDLEACLDDSYYIGWLSKRQIVSFMQGTWRAFLEGAPEVRRADRA